ncbi:Radical SAM family enzyme, similar to coproporphyrinogen III oxidase, oxygen-independent, clustered with nucleoside-triphosphatase RdgB [Cardiobacterium hominis]|uniref:Radical SAM family enzyme, similar to coproporphyrinogen III oxidase, oxygen-independent, clustered with nucleoside-triphosphatase RdgB n=1 Tax=Cardiobacterium hominis TaxID=2718 RepID=A0A1C3H3G7_9GAMM|nr:Radical SAM family enzyme, similar to coproporphyrinogen III oxidase, oxygen-independent, clustered with nucleoside-triphosphatase RdgB [Cardiobacterium hominis]
MEANPGIFEQAKFADYPGIGAGAHGQQTRDGSISRSSKYRAPGA